MDWFYLVWSPTGTTPPRRRHETEKEALNAAREMAERHPAQEFYVLKALSMSRKVTVETIELTDNPIPF